MTLFLAIRRLLAAVMVAGLMLAPLARPAMAGAAAAASMPMHGVTTHEMTTHDMAGHGMADHAMADNAMASHAAAAAATADMSAAGFDEVAEMPCCPPEAPKAPADCGKCLSMAGCSAGFLTGMLGAVAVPLPIPTKGIALASADLAQDGLGHPPPEHPPRSLI